MKPMYFTIILRFSLLLAVLVYTGCSQTQEAQKIKPEETPKTKAETVAGTRISLTPPAGFTPASQFPGYQMQSLGSSIMITELPGAPFAETSAGFSSAAELKKKGMSLLDSQNVKSNGHDALLVKIGQTAAATDFLKWALVFGDEKDTVIITATFPKRHESELSEKLKASVMSAVWDRKKDVSAAEGLNFAIDEAGELKLAKKVGYMLIYTKNAVFPSKDLDEPLLVVGQSISKTAIANHEDFAKARINQISSIADASIEQSNKITIDNLDGYEIIAGGKDKASGAPMAIYQVMLFEDQSYYLIQGLVSHKNRQSNLDVFRQMAKTFRRKKA